MASIRICDVCKYKDNKIVESEWRRGYPRMPKIDVCEKHKDYPMGNNRQEFSAKAMELLYGKPTIEISEVEIVEDPKIIPTKA